MFKPEGFLKLATESLREFQSELEDRFFDLREASKQTPSGLEIVDEVLRIAELLVDKNKKYGDSALSPLRVFSKASPQEQILVRLDDKLSRIARGVGEDEDPYFDILGYIVLLRIAKRREMLIRSLEPKSVMDALSGDSKTVTEVLDAAGASTEPAAVVGETAEVATSEAPKTPEVKAPTPCQECGKTVETDDSALCGACFKRRWGRDPVSSVPRY